MKILVYVKFWDLDSLIATHSGHISLLFPLKYHLNMLHMPAIDIDIRFHIQVMFIAIIRLNSEASIDLDKHPLFGAKNYLR